MKTPLFSRHGTQKMRRQCAGEALLAILAMTWHGMAFRALFLQVKGAKNGHFLSSTHGFGLKNHGNMAYTMLIHACTTCFIGDLGQK